MKKLDKIYDNGNPNWVSIVILFASLLSFTLIVCGMDYLIVWLIKIGG